MTELKQLLGNYMLKKMQRSKVLPKAVTEIYIVSHREIPTEFLSLCLDKGFVPIGLFVENMDHTVSGQVNAERHTLARLRQLTGVLRSTKPKAIPTFPIHCLEQRLLEKAVPVMIYGSPNSDALKFFLMTRNYLRNKLRYRSTILHPACLATQHQFKFPTYIVSGPPGCGNMVYQRVVQDILSSTQNCAKNRCKVETLLYQYCLEHWQLLQSAVSEKLSDSGFFTISGAPGGFERFQFFLPYSRVSKGTNEMEATPITITGQTVKVYSWSNPIMFSHEPLSYSSALAYAKNNVSCIQLIRHPLDVLISIAGKVSVLASSDHSNRTDLCRELLSNEDWVKSMVDALGEYFTLVADARSEIQIYSYEELIENPIENVVALSQSLDRKINKNEAQKIWSKWSARPALSKHTVGIRERASGWSYCRRLIVNTSCVQN